MAHRTTDIVIAGGGVIGMAIAYFLSKETEQTITVIDQKKPGNASWASAGGLWPIGESVGLGCGVIFFKSLSKRRRENPNTPIDNSRPHQLPDCFLSYSLISNNMFPALWKELKEEANVDFKFEHTGLKFLMYDEDDIAYAKQIQQGIPHLTEQLRWHSQQQLHQEEPYISKEAIGALTFLPDHQLNPYLLVQAFRDGARKNGVNIIENSEITDVIQHNHRVTGVKTQKQQINCSLLINAAGAWAGQIGEMIGINIPVAPVKGQVIVSERLPPIMRACISTSDCYIAQKDNGEILIGSTTEIKGFETHCSYPELRALVAGAIKALPMLKDVAIKRTWAGLRPGSPDELPILGPIPGIDGYLNACGHFRTGIVSSPITARIITDLVLGTPPPIDISPFLYERFLNPDFKATFALTENVA